MISLYLGVEPVFVGWHEVEVEVDEDAACLRVRLQEEDLRVLGTRSIEHTDLKTLMLLRVW